MNWDEMTDQQRRSAIKDIAWTVICAIVGAIGFLLIYHILP